MKKDATRKTKQSVKIFTQSSVGRFWRYIDWGKIKRKKRKLFIQFHSYTTLLYGWGFRRRWGSTVDRPTKTRITHTRTHAERRKTTVMQSRKAEATRSTKRTQNQRENRGLLSCVVFLIRMEKDFDHHWGDPQGCSQRLVRLEEGSDIKASS